MRDQIAFERELAELTSVAAPEPSGERLTKEALFVARARVFGVPLAESPSPKSKLLELTQGASFSTRARTYSLPLAESFRSAKEEYPSIDVDPDVMAGAPCIKGTRIPVYMVLDALEYHGSLEGVLQSYPHLTFEQIRDAVGFARFVLECPFEHETTASRG